MQTKNSSVLYLFALTAILISACDSSSLVSETDEEMEVIRSSMKMVLVEYGTPFGPEYVAGMEEGSVQVEIDFNPLMEPEKLSPSPFGCIATMPNRSQEFRYIGHTFFFYFEDHIIEQSDGRYQHINWRALSDDAPNGVIAGVWRCIVPFTDVSVQTMTELINMYFERNFPELEFTAEVVAREYDF